MFTEFKSDHKYIFNDENIDIGYDTWCGLDECSRTHLAAA